MKQIGALLLKIIIIAVILELILLNLTPLSFGNILFITLAVSILAYFVGDMVILPKSNNTIATISDIGLSFITILSFNYIFKWGDISFLNAFIAAVGIGVGEWFFHKLVSRTVLHNHG